MLLSLRCIAATLPALGETEASSAGEQLVEGYPSRAVTDRRRGRPPSLPAPYQPAVTVRPCLKKLPPKAERLACWPALAKVVIGAQNVPTRGCEVPVISVRKTGPP